MKRSISLKAFSIVLFVAAFFSFSSGISWAIPSSAALYIEYDLGAGLWRYDYTLYNTSDPIADAGFDVYDFFLNFSPSVALSDIASPPDWDNISDTSSFIDWYSTIPGEPPLGADIAPGASLSGFSFASDTRLASLPFNVYITNPTGGDPVLYEGTTSPVPEPTTMFLFGSGLIGLVGYGRKKFFKK